MIDPADLAARLDALEADAADLRADLEDLAAEPRCEVCGARRHPDAVCDECGDGDE